MQNVFSNPSSQKPRVLIYLFGSLGDTLVAIPALRAVRRHFQGAELVLLQNIPPNGNIVRALQVISEGLIDSCIEYQNLPGKFAKVFDFAGLWKEIRKQKFQAVVYLVISERAERSVKRDKLFFRSCGIREFYGFHAFSPAELYPRDARNFPAMTKSEAERKMIRLETDGIKAIPEDFQRPFLPLSKAEIETAENWLADRRKNSGKRLISFAPGCKTPANAWAVENFIEIGRRLLARGDGELLIIGGKAERDLADRLISEWGAGINSAGEFSVRESAALISLCDFHFGVDTGTTHLAAVMGRPCFALFHGRDNPGQWFPFGDGHRIIFHPVKCAGCRIQICPVPNHPCMTEISVEAVWDNLEIFMEDLSQNSVGETQIIAV